MSVRRRPGQDGFTLIELLVVVVIIGVLVAIAVPVYLAYEASAREDAAKADIRQVIGAVMRYNADHDALPSTRQVQTGSFTLDDGAPVTLSGDVTLTYFPVSATEFRVCSMSAKGLNNIFYYSSTEGRIRTKNDITNGFQCE